VAYRNLGSFTERGIWAETRRLSGDVHWTSRDDHARRLLFILSGTGECGGEAIGQYSAIQIERGEKADIFAADDVEILLFGLPPVVRSTETAAAA
jgi:hypothetical protein